MMALAVGLAAVTMGEQAMADPKIQQLVTPAGVPVWLVESHQIPMISVEVAVRAGTAFEPANEGGIANLTASLLDEGAGEMDSHAFKEAMDLIGMRLGASADLLDVSVNMDTLAEHKGRAFELLGLAMREPRFDDEPVARLKQATVAGLKRSEESPSAVAQKAFGPALFGRHPYARRVSGSLESVPTLTGAMAKAYHADQFTRKNMVVSVVGDITPDVLLPLVDKALAGLPEGHGRNAVETGPAAPERQNVHIQKPVPQATVLVGQFGVPRDNPDFWSVLVMNELLGGGVLTSRLFDSVREKNGLAYDVRSMNVPLPFNGSFVLSVQSDNAKVQKALDLMSAEVDRLRTVEPSQQEYDDVMAFLTGSFPLRLDSNAKILGYLTLMQMEGLGPDYLELWTARVRKVTRGDILRVAQTYLTPDRMTMVLVGNGPALKADWHPHAKMATVMGEVGSAGAKPVQADRMGPGEALPGLR